MELSALQHVISIAMPLTFSFALSQQQSFTLRCPFGSRALDTDELKALIDLCEQQYYPQRHDLPADLMSLGRRLFAWLDGKEGWLRRSLDETDDPILYLDLIQTSEAAQLNPATERVALGLAHLPWELLHDGTGFWVERGLLPVRLVQQRSTTVTAPQNRPLRLLLMATSPENIQPVLNYEQEEANILQATEQQPLALVVEESGSIAELGDLIRSYTDRHFDVFHLTGHGLIFTQAEYGYLLPNDRSLPDHTPCFITEDAVGAVQLTTVADLARAFAGRWCPVIFLSGCHTGEVPGGGTVPSMAQALVKAGAGMVLGWARPVYDHTGIVAAEAFYQELATGATVEAAVRATQQAMWQQYRADPYQQRCSDWHLLRLYGSGTSSRAASGQPKGQREAESQAALVTPLRTPKRERLRLVPAEQSFLDANRTVKVASREEFVGRRRPLQRCLRALRETSDQTGVWLAGMGGLGKSTLAARLCTRVQAQRPSMQMAVMVGPVDEAGLLTLLSGKYERFADIPALLNDLQVSLKGRLQNFFDIIETSHDQPLLLVLDDFEQNIPEDNKADGSMRLSAEAYRVLAALCAVLEESNTSSRLIVTCRYLEPATLPPHRLHLERLTAMPPADMAKKRRLLPTEIQTTLAQNPPLQNRILDVADGNPRLLEWLTAVLPQPEVETASLLTRLEQEETKFREDVLAETLINALSTPAQTALAQLSVFRLPVPAVLVANLPALDRALPLGLVEQTPDPITYRVPTILGSLLQPRLSADQWQQTWQQAAQQTYALWWETEDKPTEERSLEIVRLALLAGERDIAVTVGSRMANRWVNAARYGEAIDLCETILVQFEDVQLLLDLARAEKVVGRVTKAAAHYEQALDLCPEDDAAQRSSLWFNQAELLLQQGEVERAIALYQQSLQLLEQINDVQGKSASLHAIAGIYAQQGEVERAIALYQQSLQLYEQINDVQGKSASLHAIAGIYAQQGEVERAIALYQQSLQLKEQINDVQGKSASLHAIAGIYAQQGEVERAIALYQQSLQLKEQINDVQGKSASLHAIAGIYAQQGEVERAIALYQQSLQLKEQINDVKGKAASLHAIAGIYAQQGEVERAIALYQQSLQLYEQINDVQGKSASLHQIAGIYAQQGEVERAIALYQQSLQLKEQINDVQGKSASLHQIAGIYAQQGEVERAIALYQQSLQLKEQINDVQGKAASLHAIAGIYAQQGEVERAIALYQQSLQLLEQINDVKGKAASLHAIAGIYAQQGEVERAIALYQQSLQLKEQINDVKGKAASLHAIAGIYAQQGEVERAIALYQQSLQLLEQINDVQGKSASLHAIAGIYAQQGEVERAIALYQQSLQLDEQINDVQGKSASLHQIAGIYAQQGEVERAIALYQQSLQLYEQINDVKGKAASLHAIAGIYAQQGEVERAIALYQQSLQLYEQINDVKGKAASLHAIAGIYAQQGEVERAIALYQQSLQLYEQINDVQGKSASLHQIAGIYAQQGEVERAIALYQQSLQLKEQINDVQGKSASLHAIAGIYAQQGEVERAIALYQQSLQLKEQINDVQGKSASLHAIAGIYAQQGEVERAIALYQQSLQLLEQINDVQGKAATLANLAYWAGERGDRVRQLDLNLQAAKALGEARAYVNLFTVLGNLGGTAEANPQIYLSQALWLSLRLQVPLPDVIYLIRALYNQVPQGDDLEALLAATALWFCAQREAHPQHADLQKLAMQLAGGAAAAQGVNVEDGEAVGAWWQQQQLNDPQVFVPRLQARLEALVGDGWLFERDAF